MKPASWPHYMREKSLRDGRVAYYWAPPGRDLVKGCPVHSEALGNHYGAAAERATMLNQHLDAWRSGLGGARNIDLGARYGTVDWWVQRFQATDAFRNLSARSQDDYREALERLADVKTDTGRRVGEAEVGSLSPGAADAIYAKLRAGGAVRQANYPIDVARRAWGVVGRAYPALFMVPNPASPRERIALNPFVGVERVYGSSTTEPATRNEAYALSKALLELGHPSLAAVPLIAYEWLQRPENVLSGAISWTDYRPVTRPSHVRIEHHKTRKMIWQPLDDPHVEAGDGRFFPELEDFLAQLPRLGVPIVLLEPKRGPKSAETGKRTPRLYSLEYARHLVQEARTKAKLPSHVTFAACRHGGMTELGDAELTEQQIMALSDHSTPRAARIYVKRNEAQRMSAARARRAWVDEQAQREQKPDASRNGGQSASRNGGARKR